jgi:hypothetical protein
MESFEQSVPAFDRNAMGHTAPSPQLMDTEPDYDSDDSMMLEKPDVFDEDEEDKERNWNSDAEQSCKTEQNWNCEPDENLVTLKRHLLEPDLPIFYGGKKSLTNNLQSIFSLTKSANRQRPASLFGLVHQVARTSPMADRRVFARQHERYWTVGQLERRNL